MQKNLVIVESPAKAKTIEKFLGEDFKVMSSYGHIRDLKKKNFGVDLETFKPEYEIPDDKKNVVKELRAQARKSEAVWLASDEDREGEAISWHLAEVLKINPQESKRIVFHEITKPAILDAIAHPRHIDLNLVDAQQARRVLDRLVGFKLSPVLWRRVRPSLSAGRVQSVAVRLIVEREREIEAFQSEASYRVTAVFTLPESGKTLRAELSKRFPTEEAAAAFLEQCKTATFTIKAVNTRPAKRTPAPPFTTSTLQQEAARKLGFPVAMTMRVAQALYEAGLITYMRTDSMNLSDLCLNACGPVITEKMGAEYHQRRHYHTHAKGAQEAHEAIRPTDMRRETISGSSQEKRLYDLIWKRTIACQMADAQMEKTTVSIDVASASLNINSSSNECFVANGEVIKFEGFLKVYRESQENDGDLEEDPSILPPVKEGETLTAQEVTASERFTQQPPRYTEASLVHKMEELGIGRPSTYAPTISTILDREYVVKEGKYLRITNLGRVVTALMKERFSDIADLKFTANMEQRLDSVEEGKTAWKDVLREFYGDFEQDLENAEKALDGARIKVPDEVSEEICPECGRNLVVKSGRFGRFLACPGYPECTFTMPLVVEMPGRCPKCGGRLMKRTGNSKKTGKQYTYYCCEHVNSKDETAKCDFMTWDVPVKETCPECGHTLFKKSGRGFKKPFCINPECSNFLPEEKRGYPRKKAADSAEGAESAAAAEETAEKKPARRTAAAKKADTAKTAAKKSAAKKPAAAKTAAKKPAAKKETASKAAAKTTSSRKTAAKKTVASKAKKPAGKE